MSNILIDVSYLHSALRCVKGNATGEEDLINYYRFLGEIIAHNRVNIVLHKHGPVYEKGVEARDFFLSESHGSFEINILDSGKVDYKQVVVNCVKRLKNLPHNTFFDKNVAGNDVSPEFSFKNQSAIDFHEWLIAGKKEVPDFADIAQGGIYAPIFIASELGLHQRFEKQKDWKMEESVSLAAKIRTYMYQEIAKMHRFDYIPSATRGYNSAINFDQPTVRDLLLGSSKNYGAFKKTIAANNDIISGIITGNQCLPLDALLNTFELRKQTKPLREYLYKDKLLSVSADAVLASRFERLGELQKIKDEYLRKGELLYGLDDLNPSISASTTETGMELEVPVGKLIAKGYDMMHRQGLWKKLRPLLIPILKARVSKVSGQLGRLKANAGL